MLSIIIGAAFGFLIFLAIICFLFSHRIRSQKKIVHKHIDVWGSKIHYIEAGKTNGSAILCINGWMGSWRAFSKLIPYFEKSYRVVIVDLPGFGESEALKINHTIDNFSIFIRSFVERIGIKKFHLIGLSLGGAIAIKFTSYNSQFVEKLIVQGAPIWAELFGRWMRWGAKILKTDLAIRIADFLFDRTGLVYLVLKMQKELAHFTHEELLEKATRTGKASARAAMESALDVTRLDLRDECRNIQSPTLVIDGANVDFPPLATAELIHDLVPDSKLVLLKNSSHTLPTQKPKEFTKAILEFLES